MGERIQVSLGSPHGLEREKGVAEGWRSRLPLLWNSAVAASLAITASTAIVGRSWPNQATLAWAAVFVLVFVSSLWRLAVLGSQLRSRMGGDLLAERMRVEGPILALSLGFTASLYLSDDLYHQVLYFLQPTPAVVLVLAVMGTIAAQDALVAYGPASALDLISLSLTCARRWAIPASLLILGLLQGASYLWIIGNDFTRYWTVADAMRSLAGYPASINLTNYIEGGMYRYSIELPFFPILLLTSFSLVGHDTLGAHLPALLANTVLPLLLYGFYQKAGLGRPLAFAGACVVALFPFFRLYTLNAPVPDAVFVTLLVGAGHLFLQLVSPRPRSEVDGQATARRDSPQPLQQWCLFGILAALASLTRPEGLLFSGFMFLGLIPNLLRPRFYLAGLCFLALTVPFSIVMMSTFGIPWPRNAGNSFGLGNIAGNLDWMDRMSLSFYMDPFGLSRTSFMAVVAALTIGGAVGTIWLARRWWQAALLPLSFVVHLFAVFTVDPRVSGVDQWFDFFRHISYGIPFGALALFTCTQRAVQLLVDAARGRIGRASAVSTATLAALLLLAFAAYELHLLARPSLTWGPGGTQLLTSDMWVTFPDLITYRYKLPDLPFAPVEGLTMIDPSFDYMSMHLEYVKHFFEPLTAINTGKGSQYEVSSLLVLLFGAAFTLWPGRNTRPDERPGAEIDIRGAVRNGLRR